MSVPGWFFQNWRRKRRRRLLHAEGLGEFLKDFLGFALFFYPFRRALSLGSRAFQHWYRLWSWCRFGLFLFPGDRVVGLNINLDGSERGTGDEVGSIGVDGRKWRNFSQRWDLSLWSQSFKAGLVSLLHAEQDCVWCSSPKQKRQWSWPSGCGILLMQSTHRMNGTGETIKGGKGRRKMGEGVGGSEGANKKG